MIFHALKLLVVAVYSVCGIEHGNVGGAVSDRLARVFPPQRRKRLQSLATFFTHRRWFHAEKNHRPHLSPALRSTAIHRTACRSIGPLPSDPNEDPSGPAGGVAGGFHRHGAFFWRKRRRRDSGRFFWIDGVSYSSCSLSLS